MKQFACGDVVPGCVATFVAGDTSGILAAVAHHAHHAHGLTEISPELVRAVETNIRMVAA